MIIKDLGAVSAYAYAVEKGYTGTEEEFATLMASYATVAEEAAESAESASTSATSASTSAQTATIKASEASTAAQTATAKAEETQADADAAALDASQALSAASTATTKASEAAQSASDAVTAKTAAQTAQTAAEGSATTAQTAAQTATQKAAEAAESARTLTIDTTLTQSGQAADSKVVGDEIGAIKEELTTAVNYDTSDNIFDKDKLSAGRLNGNWGSISDWSDFNYSDYIKTTATVIYFSQRPYEVVFYNNGTRVGIYPANQLIADENGWYKTPAFSSIHDGFAFDFSTTATATYYIDSNTLMVGESNLGTEYVPYANYPTLYGNRAALYAEIPSIPSIPKFKSGQTNYFVGKNSGINTTEASSGDNGKYNSAFGVDAFKANTEGDHCTAIGFQALAKNTTGDGNTACGEDALYENLTGTSNVAVGSHCLQNATKSSNTSVGASALISQTTGFFNTAIGVQAGRNFGTAENAITTDDRMTLIGGYANKKVSTSLTNSTVIGFQAQADKSNQVVIGNESVVEIVLGNKVLVFNEDGTVAWTNRT